MNPTKAPIGRAAREAARLVQEEDLSVAFAVVTACASEGVEDHHAVLDLLRRWVELSKQLG